MTIIAFLTTLLLLSAAPSPAGESLSFRSWRARAERQEREKDLEAAHSSWSNALSTWRASDGKPARAKAYCARATLRAKREEDAGALSDWSECLELAPKNAKALHRRGALRLKAGKRSEAIADFYKAVALDIRFAAAYHDRARAYEQSGEEAFAKEDYKRACELGAREACPKAKSLKAPAPPASADVRAQASFEPVPRKPAKPAYTPRFADCREALEACLDEGGAFGACVSARPSCDKQAVKGCCPAPCVKAFGKLAAVSSEAEAFRRHFAADAACGAAPRSDGID